MDLQKFSEYQSRMQTGDLIAIHGEGPVSNIIRLKTRSFWSHCGIVLRFPIERLDKWLFMIHASKHMNGVSLVLLSRYLQNLTGVAGWVPMNHEKAEARNPQYRENIIYRATMEIGLPFDINTLYHGAFGRIAKNLFPALFESWCCSWLAARLLQYAGLISNTSLTPEELTRLSFYEPAKPLYPNERDFECWTKRYARFSEEGSGDEP